MTYIWCKDYHCKKSLMRLFAFHVKLEKGINTSLLYPPLNKIIGHLGSLALARQLVSEKEIL